MAVVTTQHAFLLACWAEKAGIKALFQGYELGVERYLAKYSKVALYALQRMYDAGKYYSHLWIYALQAALCDESDLFRRELLGYFGNQVLKDPVLAGELLVGAVRFNRTDKIHLLLQHGVSPNVRARDGLTPLMRAAMDGLMEPFAVLYARTDCDRTLRSVRTQAHALRLVQLRLTHTLPGAARTSLQRIACLLSPVLPELPVRGASGSFRGNRQVMLQEKGASPEEEERRKKQLAFFARVRYVPIPPDQHGSI